MLLGASLLACLGVAPAVLGQAPLNTRARLRAAAPVQTGVSLDRNPQLGGAGFNYTRPASPLLAGNAIASGVASGGMSFRGFQPIPDPTAFQAPLGSAALSDFRRDSVSIASPALGSAPYGQTFYDPSTTVPTVNMLESLAGVRAVDAGPGSPYSLNLRIQTRINPQTGLAAQIVGLQPPATPASPQAPLTPVTASLATTSSIFGTEIPRAPMPPGSELPWRRGLPDQTREQGPGRENQGTEPEPELPGVSELLSRPLGGPLRTQLDERMDTVLAQNQSPAAVHTGLVLPPEPTAEAVLPATPRTVDVQLLPGFDIFTDMRLALAMMSNPNAPWLDEIRRVLRERPDLTGELGEEATQDPAEFLDHMLHTPLRTLAGAGSSALNDQMLKAESALSIGHFAEASDRYEAAHLIDPSNPLPLIGKGHALLAQGNYLSAAVALTQGIELADRTPGLVSALLNRLDLKALMGGGEVIDIRRADIMRRLEREEDPSLRFLLGYLEYHSGDKAHGLENLKRAAENPRAGMIIARYPALLRAETTPAPSGGAASGETRSGSPRPEDLPRRAVSSRPAGELVVPPRSE
jgi:hypothetical protein